jgi:hypothetical protein
MTNQILSEEFRRMQKLAGILNEDDSRSELHRIVKGILVAAKSTAGDSETREKALEKELKDLMKKHPEFTEEMVEKLQDKIADKLK